MITNPELMFLQAIERRRELEADAAQYRLLAAGRRERRAAKWWAAHRGADRQPAQPAVPAESGLGGSLAACAASAGSAR